jgi:hypothetical protein
MGIQSFLHPMRLAKTLLLMAAPPLFGQTLPTLSTPLRLPSAIVYDAQGDLYIAETGNHVVRLITAAGALSTVAGNGTQGFAGDGGLASLAELDSPSGVALDAAGNLYIADSHNQRVRRVDAVLGTIATVAGNGSAGAAGDGGLATGASLRLPAAVAVDSAGDLLIADSGNQRIRRVDAVTGIITTVAGNSTQGLSGDGGLATAAQIDSPAGLAFDAVGNLYVADSHNRRVRRIDRASRIVTTVAASTLTLPRGVAVDAQGNLYVADVAAQTIRRVEAASGATTAVAGLGTQGFAGDGQAAVAAEIDSPRGVALSPAGLVTLADGANQRVRQVDAAGIIHTIGGLGSTASGTLTLSGAATDVYGTGSVTATLVSSAASGSVTFYDAGSGTPVALATLVLGNNVAELSTSHLATGSHTIAAVYSGDATHAAASSAALGLVVTPASVSAVPVSVAMLYGQTVPPLTGSVSGILAQDAGTVSAGFSSAATQFSAPGAYPIAASLSGVGAANYTLTTMQASVTVGQAPSLVELSASPMTAALGASVMANVHVASGTSGVPTGSVALLDSLAGASGQTGATVGISALNGTGDASFSVAALAQGSHLLTAVYTGDTNFMGSSSAPEPETIGAAASPDFSVATSGTASQVVQAGAAASYSFLVSQIAAQGVTLSSPIVLAASGMPFGATVSFSPAYLPPGSGPAAFVLTVQTPQVAWLVRTGGGVTVALLLAVPLALGRKRRWVAGALCWLTLGCGARVNTGLQATAGSTSYPIVVTATATGVGGTVLTHTATVMLIVQ